MSDDAPAPYDPDGVDVALDLIADMASIEPAMPAPRLGPPRTTRRGEQRRGNVEFTAVGDVVGEMVVSKGWQGRVSLQMLQARWPELAGDINAAHSRPVALEGKVVRVVADSTTWAAALRLIAAQLVAKINRAIGDGSVSQVDVRGPSSPTWKHGPLSVRDGRGPRDTYG